MNAPAPKDSGVVPEWWTTHARNPDRALPGGIFASNDFRGDPITTPTDHRMLWKVRDDLIAAPPYLRATFELLNDYLAANCQHHWVYYKEEAGYCEAHRQCTWCNDVVVMADD